MPWILGWFLVVALLTELYGFLHFRVGVYPIGPVPVLGWDLVQRPDYEARMSGTFGCPNHFGNYLVQASLAALTLMAWPGCVWPIWCLVGTLASAWSFELDGARCSDFIGGSRIRRSALGGKGG